MRDPILASQIDVVPLAFAAARTDDELVIDLFDSIGRGFWSEGITAKSIARALAEHGDAKSIVVRVNSPGGDVFEGTAIYNLLRAHGGNVTVRIIGIAASMASVIALAGSRVEMAANALFMIHNPWALEIGDANEMRRTAAWLDKIKTTLLEVYDGHSNLGRDAIAKLMDAETWMTAAEAEEAGFVDEVLAVADEPEDDDSADAKARGRAIVAKFQRAPQQVHDRFAVPRIAAMAQPKGNATMDREELIKLLGLSATATDDDIRAAVKARAGLELIAAPLTEVVPRADFDAMRAENERLKAAAEAKAKADFEALVDLEIGAAVKAGKVTPAGRDYHRKQILARGAEALADFRTYVATQPELVGDTQGARAEHRSETAPPSTTGEVRKLCAQLGITVEEFEASRKSIAEDPETYRPEAYRFAR